AAEKALRARTSPALPAADKEAFIAAIHDALLCAKICSYAQGMALIRAGSEKFKWNINLAEMARIWKGGCIIRARLLDTIMRAYKATPDIRNLLLASDFEAMLFEAQPNWRKVIGTGAALGIPTPAFSASLAYFDSYRTSRLPQNLTQ